MRWSTGLVVLVGLGCGSEPPGSSEGDGSTSAGSTDGASTSAVADASAATVQGTDDGVVDGSGSDGVATSAASEESTGSDFPPPTLDDCIDDGSAGDHVYSCEHLSYDVTIPELCLQQACGVIMDVHGFTMSGQMQEANTSLRQLGAGRGYIVVQPNANPPPPSSSWNPLLDDDAVVDFMLRIAVAFHADLDRLHFTGFSQGGFMSWRVVCEHADVLASVAPAAACGSGFIPGCDFGPGSQPSEPVDILYMHGTDDVLVPYTPCAPAQRDAVVDAYGLGREQLVTMGDGYTWTRHTGPDGTVLEFISHDHSAANTIVLGGHCFPGSDDPGNLPGQLMSYACVEQTELHWGEAVLDFFDAHPRR